MADALVAQAAASGSGRGSFTGADTSPAALAALPIHPALKQQPIRSRNGSASSNAGEDAAPLAGSYSRDSFRHSFVEIDHPLAQRHSVAPGFGPLPEDDAEAEQGDSATDPSKPAESLSSIIKSALQQATDRDSRQSASPPAASPSFGPLSGMASPPASFAASLPLPASPMSVPTTHITMARTIKLLTHFIHSYSKNPSSFRTSAKSMVIQTRITALARLDYHLAVISNDGRNVAASNLAAASTLNQSHAAAAASQASAASATDSSYEYCNSYPLELLIFENERTGPFGVGDAVDRESFGSAAAASSAHTLQSRVNDASVLRPLFRLSRFSRVHGRFVIPVILVRNKNICRSSTLAIQAEAMLNNLHAKGKEVIANLWDSFSSFGGAVSGASALQSGSGAVSSPHAQSSAVQVGLEGQRGHDVQLLLHTATSYIEDLMVETGGKKKLGVTLTSSEKNEPARYSAMKLNALPYPGCEFFTNYQQNSHNGCGLIFNWQQSFVSSDLLLSNPSPMIPDEMLSCNGRLHAGKKSPSQVEEDLAPWYEFQHSCAEHQSELERQRQLESERLQAVAAAAEVAQAVASPPEPPSPPPALSAVDVFDELLSHSASAFSTEAMAVKSPQEDSLSVGVTASNGGSAEMTDAAAFPSAGAASSADAAAASSTRSVAAAASTVAAAAAAPSSAAAPITSFSLYRSWDVITLTKNYLLILLAHIADESPNSGVLVHCISGWDRTPLFISLLRISLWADGEVHRNLNAMQMLYFTLGYDWMLFGHALHNRLEKNEDVIVFCFDLLQYITHTKFSLQTATEMRQRKRIVEVELNIERSASPASATKPAEQPAPRKSALTSALQAQSNGASAPPLRKSASDGSGAAASSAFHANSHSAGVGDDAEDGRASLLVTSTSPSKLSAMPSSYTALKPHPSLSSFIIESHSSDQQAQFTTPVKSASAAASASPDAAIASPRTPSEPEDEPLHRSSSTTIPIPIRKTSSHKGSPLPPSGLEQRIGSAKSTTPVLAGHSLTQEGSLIHAPALSLAASQGVLATSQMSRVNSWTLLSSSINPAHATPTHPTTHSSLSPEAMLSSSCHLEPPSFAAKTSNGAKASPAASSRPSPAPFSTQPPAAATAASMRRCERLLELRSLFLSAWTHVLPASVPPPNSPHAKFTAHAAAARQAAAQRKAASAEAAAAPPAVDARNGSATASASPATPKTLPIAAPVAARVTPSGGWFSS